MFNYVLVWESPKTKEIKSGPSPFMALPHTPDGPRLGTWDSGSQYNNGICAQFEYK